MLENVTDTDEADDDAVHDDRQMPDAPLGHDVGDDRNAVFGSTGHDRARHEVGHPHFRQASAEIIDGAGKITLLVFDADRDTERLGAAGYKFRYVPYFALPKPDGHPAEEHEMKGKAGAQTTEEIGQQLEAWQRKGG